MQIGAIIEKGLEDWQIIQQINGQGSLSFSGYWNSEEEIEEPRVFSRVVKEETGEIVVPWTPSKDLGNQKWQMTIEGVPAGGLYRIETCLHSIKSDVFEWSLRGDTIYHIGVGDVYIIAGQSNSVGYGKDPLYDPPEFGVHLFRNSGKWDIATHPLGDSTNTIHPVNRDGANVGHSPYLSFAKMLKRELGYPIGLIQTALGGSPLSRWNTDENGDLYANMVECAKCCGGKVKGVLWYQGCSDANEQDSITYLDRFKNMVDNMRRDLENDQLAILTIQLNRCLGETNEVQDRGWSVVREAQRQAMLTIPGVYMIPALDSILSDGIHNASASNQVLGERLARVALGEIYKRGMLSKIANPIQATKIGKQVCEIEFENVYHRIYALDAKPGQLALKVEDDEGLISIKQYDVRNSNILVLTLDREIKGSAKIHHGYGQNPEGTLLIDFATHIPVCAFYNLEVESND